MSLSVLNSSPTSEPGAAGPHRWAKPTSERLRHSSSPGRSAAAAAGAERDGSLLQSADEPETHTLCPEESEHTETHRNTQKHEDRPFVQSRGNQTELLFLNTYSSTTSADRRDDDTGKQSKRKGRRPGAVSESCRS